MMIPNILLVEDDPNLGFILKEYLDLKGYSVDLCSNGEEGWTRFNENQYDVCLLDVMMPKMDGFSLIRLIRQKDQNVPVIFITARSMSQDKIEGFKLGADDYLTKPISMEELQVRIDAILRRVQQQVGPGGSERKVVYDIGLYQFDYDQQTLRRGTNIQKLTSKESSLLKLLLDFQDTILAREYALKLIWKEDNYFTARSMDVYITKLRKYLNEDPNLEIKNIHGKGYRLIKKSEPIEITN